VLEAVVKAAHVMMRLKLELLEPLTQVQVAAEVVLIRMSMVEQVVLAS
tara:strand:- start:86 stop:229 length:144 start_codon:yes stop_codon:yes gene_type:complete